MYKIVLQLFCVASVVTSASSYALADHHDRGAVFDKFSPGVFLIYPDGSPEPTGVATLVHKDGFFVTTHHATMWEPEHAYFLRRSSELAGPGSQQTGYRTFRISNAPIHTGYISLLKVEDERWAPDLLPGEVPQLCLDYDEAERFSGMYIMFEVASGEADFRLIQKTIGKYFFAARGTHDGESGSLVLRDNLEGVGVVEGHFDKDPNFEGMSADDLRRLLTTLEKFYIVPFNLSRNVHTLSMIPHHPSLIAVKDRLELEAQDDAFAGINLFFGSVEKTGLDSISAYNAIDTFTRRGNLCSVFKNDDGNKLNSFVQMSYEFARQSCTRTLASSLIAERIYRPLYKGSFKEYCEVQPDDETPTERFEIDSNQTRGEGASLEMVPLPIDLATQISADVAYRYSLESANVAEDDDLQDAVLGAVHLLEASIEVEEARGNAIPRSLSDAYANAGELALISDSPEVYAKARGYLGQAMKLAQNEKATALLASLDLREKNLERAATLLARLNNYQGDFRYDAAISEMYKQLWAEAPSILDPNEKSAKLRIGVLGGENTADRLAAYSCLQDILAGDFGFQVEVEATPSYNQVIEGLLLGTIDAAWLGASGYAATWLQSPEAVEPILVKVNKDGGYAYHSIGFARKDSGITSLADMRGKVLGFGDPNSTSGFLIPSIEIPEVIGATMDSGDYFGEVKFTGGHEQTIVAVNSGDISAGVTWADDTGSWEDGFNSGALRMAAAQGLVDMDELVEIWRSRPIPEGPVVVRRSLPDYMKSLFADTMVGLQERDPECAYGVMAADALGFRPIDHSAYEVIVEARSKKLSP